MATLTICRKRHTQSSPYSAFSEELSRPSSQQRAAKRTLGKFLLTYAVQIDA